MWMSNVHKEGTDELGTEFAFPTVWNNEYAESVNQTG